MNFFNVPADRRYFAYSGAVFQHEGRHDAARVDRAVGIGMLLALAKIDCDEGIEIPFSATNIRTRRELGEEAEW
jgi:hypothetical protein